MNQPQEKHAPEGLAASATLNSIPHAARRTTLMETARSLIDDEPSSGVNAWLRTTGVVVALLIALQIITGVLLTFYYVPAIDSAYATVVYIEKVVPAGSWIRALHHYGSQWLTLALALHLAQMFWQRSYRRSVVAWLSSLVFLALALSSGATGYSLAWDARSFFSTRIAEGITGALPFIGESAREWLLGGTEISTLTLSRFYALHALVLFALLLLTATARLFVFREPNAHSLAAPQPEQAKEIMRAALTRNALIAGAVFLALSLYAAKYHAPLAPSADIAAQGYLPRPGAQFLWLFQLLKYFPGRFASIIAATLPGIVLAWLAALPFLEKDAPHQNRISPARRINVALFIGICVLVCALTAMAYVDDARDPQVRAQLARQQAEEDAFRRQPFVPKPIGVSVLAGTNDEIEEAAATNNAMMNDAERQATKTSIGAVQPAASHARAPAEDTAAIEGRASSPNNAPPDAYTNNCASCHGSRGQGKAPFPKLIGVGSKPRRAVEDIIALLNDPAAYNLHEPMESFAATLSENEKRRIAEWLVTLKKKH